MTTKQKLLKAMYPFLMALSKLIRPNKWVQVNTQNAKPTVSFYTLSAETISGSNIFFHELQGKKVLIVNTASDCGFTGQYAQLESLYKQYRNSLVVIAFPANDFQNQETADDSTIGDFCRINYGVSFPIIKKCQVVKGTSQHEVFAWLTNAAKNGWNNQQPVWNFSKYLINEEGMLTHYFAPNISPLEKVVINAITKNAL